MVMQEVTSTEYLILIGLIKATKFQSGIIRRVEGGCLSELRHELSLLFPSAKINDVTLNKMIFLLKSANAIEQTYKLINGREVTAYVINPDKVFDFLKETTMFISTEDIMKSRYTVVID